MILNKLEEIEAREIMPGFRGRMIHGENMTLAYWEIDKGAVLPEHSHVHEQSANVLEGEFELIIEGKSHIYKPGEVAMIPSNAIHSGHAVTDCKILDVFAPVREDYR